MNTTVSFEIAVLLKQKEFELPTIYYYDSFGDKCSGNSKTNWNKSQELLCSAPTLSEVVMWLYETHDIWIVSLPELTNGTDITYYPCVYEGGVGEDLECCFNLPTEAYEAAIEHCLTNLI